MPLYSFFNDETQESIDVLMSMNDKHEYFDESGHQWRRIYYSPMASIDSKMDCRNKNDFIRKGAKYNDLGSVIDKSRELSDARAQKDGVDPVKRKFFDDYSKNRGNKKHIADRPSVIENSRVKIELD